MPRNFLHNYQNLFENNSIPYNFQVFSSFGCNDFENQNFLFYTLVNHLLWSFLRFPNLTSIFLILKKCEILFQKNYLLYCIMRQVTYKL